MILLWIFLIINPSPKQATIDLLRPCHINPRSESFVFKNVIPRDEHGQAPFDLALPRRVDCRLFGSRVNTCSPEALGPERYRVMREKGTERAFSGQYLYDESPGHYVCAACKNPLFAAEDQYDSGAGWPSFKKPIQPKALYYLEDWNFPFQRYEVLCRGCDSHLGHVFNDGPPPKGLRYCVNSIALVKIFSDQTW